MARGWESKSVEAQIESASETPSQHKPALTAEQAAKLHRETGLLLSRKHVLQQLETAQNVRHRKILEQALADLDTLLANRDW
jgi:hypothetical protein